MNVHSGWSATSSLLSRVVREERGRAWKSMLPRRIPWPPWSQRSKIGAAIRTVFTPGDRRNALIQQAGTAPTTGGYRPSERLAELRPPQRGQRHVHLVTAHTAAHSLMGGLAPFRNPSFYVIPRSVEGIRAASHAPCDGFGQRRVHRGRPLAKPPCAREHCSTPARLATRQSSRSPRGCCAEGLRFPTRNGHGALGRRRRQPTAWRHHSSPEAAGRNRARS